MQDKNAERLRVARELYHDRRAPEAVAILDDLLKKEPSNPDYRVQQSLYLRAIGKFEESAHVLTGVPQDMPGRKMLSGWHKLREGKFLEGFTLWKEESGLYRAEKRIPFPTEKKLSAGADLTGKRVFLALEGGVGDEVAYVRFAQRLTERGARVIAGTSADLAPIIKRAQGVAETCPLEAISHDQYDFYLPSLDAIPLLGIENPANGISFPYISASATYTDTWQDRIAEAAPGKKRIGIQWHGNLEFDHVEFKSIPWELFIKCKDAGKLFSLQRDTTPEQLQELEAFDTQAGSPDWEATLACIAEMDVIICGDTTIAHMAGALGKKVLLLLPHAPHAYWAGAESGVSWYPTVHIYRQPSYGNWEGATKKALAGC